MQYGALRSQDRTISISIRRPVCFACGRPKEGSGKETGNDLCYFLFLFLEGSASPSGFDLPLPVGSVLVCEGTELASPVFGFRALCWTEHPAGHSIPGVRVK